VEVATMDGGIDDGRVNKYPNYVQDQQMIVKFFKDFERDDEQNYSTFKPMMEMLQQVANRTRKTVEIRMDDILSFTGSYDLETQDFVERVIKNTKRYETLFCESIDDMLEGIPPTQPIVDDVHDILQKQREAQFEEMQAQARRTDGGGGEKQDDQPLLGVFPVSLRRHYQIKIIAPAKMKPAALREIKAEKIGQLVRVRAMVTRITDVKPLMRVATYTCDACGCENYLEVNSRSFMPLLRCQSKACQTNGNPGRLHPQTRGSKFEKYQEAKVQELPHQVPMGHIPRTMTVVLRGEITRRCGPGDIVGIDGVFLPIPFTGYRQMTAGLVADTFLEAMHIEKAKKGYQEMSISDEMRMKIQEISEKENMYEEMARSIAPEIFGHRDVKKALLLMMIGGVTRTMHDGMKIRGDLNVCLVGDPGVAKSQLLKQISSLAPRGVYTTGKGSSGVGLTAAVVKDSVTGEMTLEGGALVLADKGICCIDEFDKMDEQDRTAIHEVMEQQTVSIAKAGITTTLNARTSVLAAANPIDGRYNPNRNLQSNINLPNALLSRFDLLFVLLDKTDHDADIALAKHVVHVHRHGQHPELDFEPVDKLLMKSYIAVARCIEPCIPPTLTNHITEAYVALRQKDKEESMKAGGQHVMTARQLLSILRLSQALARLRLSERVSEEDITEAIRLVRESKASVQSDNGKSFQSGDRTSKIFDIIKQYVNKRGQNEIQMEIQMVVLEPMILSKGFTKDEFEVRTGKG
jgi:DNA replication licensing factor MCM7